MKRLSTITIVLLLSFLTLESFAQKRIKSPDLKIGIGYPYVFGNVTDVQWYHKITGFPTLSVEKPYPIQHKRKNMYSINPGISYYFFKEHQEWGTALVGRNFKLNHQSLNVYSKFLYQKKFYGPSTGFIYMGVIGGFHLLTKTTGTRESRGLTPGEPVVIANANEPAKDFYGSVFYGAVLGIQPKAKITNVIKPSIEAMFFPGLVKRETRNSIDDEMVAQITIFLGLRLK